MASVREKESNLARLLGSGEHARHSSQTERVLTFAGSAGIAELAVFHPVSWRKDGAGATGR